MKVSYLHALVLKFAWYPIGEGRATVNLLLSFHVTFPPVDKCNCVLCALLRFVSHKTALHYQAT